MTNETEKLRELLDKHGVAYKMHDDALVYTTRWGDFCAFQSTSPNERLTMAITPEQAIAITLSNNKVTAKQVCEAIERRFGSNPLASPAQWDAIADELNAVLGADTCYDLWEDSPFANFKCSECNEEMISHIDKKRIACCPFCERKVRKQSINQKD